VQAIAVARNIAIQNKSGKMRKKATLIRKILHRSRKVLKLRKRRSVGPHLRYNPGKKCRTLVVVKRSAAGGVKRKKRSAAVSRTYALRSRAV